MGLGPKRVTNILAPICNAATGNSISSSLHKKAYLAHVTAIRFLGTNANNLGNKQVGTGLNEIKYYAHFNKW